LAAPAVEAVDHSKCDGILDERGLVLVVPLLLLLVVVVVWVLILRLLALQVGVGGAPGL